MVLLDLPYVYLVKRCLLYHLLLHGDLFLQANSKGMGSFHDHRLMSHQCQIFEHCSFINQRDIRFGNPLTATRDYMET